MQHVALHVNETLHEAFASAVEDLNDSNFCVAGSNRSIVCDDHSETHTRSVSSTYTAYTRGASPGAFHCAHCPLFGS